MKYFNVLIIALGIIFSSVAQTAQTPINASVIYEVNVRQFSKEGTFAEVQKALNIGNISSIVISAVAGWFLVKWMLILLINHLEKFLEERLDFTLLKVILQVLTRALPFVV